MRAYRIASPEYPITSSSARAGRWNLKHTHVIYASTSKALAGSEILVNRGAIAEESIVIEIEIPDDIAVAVIDPVKRFGSAWKAKRGETAAFGTRWADRQSDDDTAVMIVPSSIWQGDDQHNVILNPNHPDFSRIEFRISQDDIDPRLVNPPRNS